MQVAAGRREKKAQSFAPNKEEDRTAEEATSGTSPRVRLAAGLLPGRRPPKPAAASSLWLPATCTSPSAPLNLGGGEAARTFTFHDKRGRGGVPG